ncbi:hypothetical protein [Thalassobacillus hwangdonensis]|uniref:Uncharacterized protein n=1 Tax=Thalassobacillus hwangdonensis TaxID=546108 RepID=A0ABW3KW22_9BACI
MKPLVIIMMGLLIAIAFLLNIFGLMRLYPLYFTSPLLFFLLFTTIKALLHRRRFKGFQ